MFFASGRRRKRTAGRAGGRDESCFLRVSLHSQRRQNQLPANRLSPVRARAAVSPGRKKKQQISLFFLAYVVSVAALRYLCCDPPPRPSRRPTPSPLHLHPSAPPGLTKIQFTGCQLDSIILSAAPWWRGSSLNPPFTVAPGYSYIYRRLPLTTTSATSVFHTMPPPLGRSWRRVGESCSVSLEISPPLFLPSPPFFCRLGGDVCSLSFCKKREKKKNPKHIHGGAHFPVAALRFFSDAPAQP